MIYTLRTPATLLLGMIMTVYGWMVKTGGLDGMIAVVGQTDAVGEMVAIALAAGTIGIIGFWQLLATPRKGLFDYYLSAAGGALFILLMAFVIKWWLAPAVAVASHALGPILGHKFVHDILSLSYIVLGILAGIIIVNVFKIPGWAEQGVRLSRLALKTGVILLGALYSARELRNLAGLSIIMIGFFVLGSVLMVL